MCSLYEYIPPPWSIYFKLLDLFLIIVDLNLFPHGVSQTLRIHLPPKTSEYLCITRRMSLVDNFVVSIELYGELGPYARIVP